jgi:polysaccharide export outer membrane protein
MALVLLCSATFGVAAQGGASPRAEYVLGAGDVVHIVVYQNPDLTSDVRVSEAGSISFPLIGAVKVGGLTTGQAEKRIADALKSGNFVKQPQVSILVAQVRGNQASVLGQVNKPGRYALEVADMRLTDVLAMAGGVAPTGGDLVTVVGTRNNQPYRVEIDLPTVFAAGKRGEDLIVQNGDVIWVDHAPMVYIYGEVQKPGVQRLERGMSVMQLLAAGGGLTQRGTEKGLQLRRRGADGKVQATQPSMDDPLRDGDVVYVKESLF